MVCLSHLDFDMCFATQRLRATVACTVERPSQLPKAIRACKCFSVLTLKRVSRHNGVQLLSNSTFKSAPNVMCFADFAFEMCFVPQRHTFFHIPTSKNVPKMVCLSQFELEMCFAPQRRALFEHVNVPKCSNTQVFLAF